MDIGTSRLNLRMRNHWEAMDLGVRLWAERKGLYMALWATFFLPLLLLLTLLFWQSPWWGGLVLWWLKPVFEAPMLRVLSEQVFVTAPSYRTCLANAAGVLWHRRLLGDLTWRRLSLRRSFVLPVAQLEELTGAAYVMRTTELSRHGAGPASWLTFFGVHFEAILTYGLLIVGYWLWFGSPIQDALVQSASWSQVVDSARTMMQLLGGDHALWLYHVFNLLYALVLCFWGPVYVAAGFGLYLHARTLAEAWDVRLAARQLSARLQHPLGLVLALVLGAGLFWHPVSVLAEPLPDATQVQANRRALLEAPPFAHVKTDKRYCWQSCDQVASVPTATPSSAPALLNTLIYVLVAVVLLAVGGLFWRWYAQRVPIDKPKDALPQALFGMALTPETLPEDVIGAVRQLWPQDARAAMSLLYRASLVQLHDHYGILLKDSDTEGEVLNRVQAQGSFALGAYWRELTQLWLRLAYGHRTPQADAVMRLCDGYAALLVDVGTAKEAR